MRAGAGSHDGRGFGPGPGDPQNGRRQTGARNLQTEACRHSELETTLGKQEQAGSNERYKGWRDISQVAEKNCRQREKPTCGPGCPDWREILFIGGSLWHLSHCNGSIRIRSPICSDKGVRILDTFTVNAPPCVSAGFDTENRQKASKFKVWRSDQHYDAQVSAQENRVCPKPEIPRRGSGSEDPIRPRNSPPLLGPLRQQPRSRPPLQRALPRAPRPPRRPSVTQRRPAPCDKGWP